MIRKQLYLGEQQERKLKRLAAQWHCPEAEVVRRAVDQLPEPQQSVEDQILERLRQANALMERTDYPDLPKGAAARKLRKELERKIHARKEPIGLTEAVLQDRQERDDLLL